MPSLLCILVNRRSLFPLASHLPFLYRWGRLCHVTAFHDVQIYQCFKKNTDNSEVREPETQPRKETESCFSFPSSHCSKPIIRMEKHQEWGLSGKMRTSSIYENWKVRAWGRVGTRASTQNSQTIYLGVVEDSRAKSPKLGFRATEWLKRIQATRGPESFNPVRQPPSHLRGLRATSLPCVGSDIWRVMLSL